MSEQEVKKRRILPTDDGIASLPLPDQLQTSALMNRLQTFLPRIKEANQGKFKFSGG